MPGAWFSDGVKIRNDEFFGYESTSGHGQLALGRVGACHLTWCNGLYYKRGCEALVVVGESDLALAITSSQVGALLDFYSLGGCYIRVELLQPHDGEFEGSLLFV